MRPREIPCPSNRGGCKYQPNCHLSEHHPFARRTADTEIKRAFGNLAVNKMIVCRHIHDILDTFPPMEYPPEDKMIQTIREERSRRGEI